jgi:hypothetical protein
VYFGLGVSSRAVALARESLGWNVPVLANSALMFGYARPDWRDGYAGWEYIDTVADDNPQRAALSEISPRAGGGPIGCAAYDIGRLLGEGIAQSDTSAGIADGLRKVKQLPATSGHDGTLIGFGTWTMLRSRATISCCASGATVTPFRLTSIVVTDDIVSQWRNGLRILHRARASDRRLHPTWTHIVGSDARADNDRRYVHLCNPQLVAGDRVEGDRRTDQLGRRSLAALQAFCSSRARGTASPDCVQGW